MKMREDGCDNYLKVFAHVLPNMLTEIHNIQSLISLKSLYFVECHRDKEVTVYNSKIVNYIALSVFDSS